MIRGIVTKITKISTPRKLPAIRYVEVMHAFCEANLDEIDYRIWAQVLDKEIGVR